MRSREHLSRRRDERVIGGGHIAGIGPSAARLIAGLICLSLSVNGSRMRAQPTECDLKAAVSTSFSANCPETSNTCTFTVTSPIPPGALLQWDFGDGDMEPGATGPQISHAYQAAGYYVVTLVVTAPQSETGVAILGVLAGSEPPPLAADDFFTVDAGKTLAISTQELLANDAPGAVFVQSFHPCSAPAGASTCTYSAPSQPGTASFTYSIRDGSANNRPLSQATVHITITHPLLARPDSFETRGGTTLRITSQELLVNDSPPNAVFHGAENATNGTLRFVEINAAGFHVYDFVPAPLFIGLAGFEYVISRNGAQPFDRGVVDINVIDGPPNAAFDVFCTNRTCSVSNGSTDDIGIVRYIWNWGDGTPLIEQTGPPQPPNPAPHTYAVSGRYTITLTVFDTIGQSHSFAREVLANTKPVAVNDTASTDRDVAKLIKVLANDSDADGDALTIHTVTISHPGAAWQIVPDGSSWAILLTPPDTFVGTLTFTYVATDRWGATATGTVTLTVNQWTSITDAVGEQFFCPFNLPISIPHGALLQNDFDSDLNANPPDVLTIVSRDTSILMGILTCPTGGTACTYQPPHNGSGFTLFRYTIQDNAGHRDTATVRIYVGVTGQPPTVQDDYIRINRNTARTFTMQELTQNDIDPLGDTLTVLLSAGARDYGALTTCSIPMYHCTYTPNSGFVGVDRFLYTAWDTLHPQQTAWIHFLVEPPWPSVFDAREDLISTGVGQQKFFSRGLLASNDYDPEAQPITVSSIDSTGLLGTLTCDASGCTYKPGTGFQGTTRFRYTAVDTQGNTDTAVVRIRVGSANNPPVVVPNALTTVQNTVKRFSIFELLSNDYDPDNDPLNVTVFGQTATKGTLTCGNPNYWCTYSPQQNMVGTDTITYTVTDSMTTVTSTFTINILYP